MNFRLLSLFAVVFISLTACGTTFSLPEIDNASQAQATKMFTDPKASASRPQISVARAEQRFRRVASRIEPVARAYCTQVMAGRKDFNCQTRIEIDRKLQERNAYFTYENKIPVIRLTLPLLRDTRSDDEVAFIMSHEFGHLLGRHIEKRTQQQVAGAIILGSIAAAANAQTTAYGGYADPNLVNDSVELGMAIGSVAYSQTYELESDTLGTHIAHSAGYDPVSGAQYFARPDEPKRASNKLSFWGTHPPDAKRVATVIAAKKQIDSGRGLALK